jgi:hypothetical protein
MTCYNRITFALQNGYIDSGIEKKQHETAYLVVP